ncbi:MAG: MobA/MobL family protein [Burkholderiales bacterium]|jgi:hypothetical protein|nr:MobA/MobL family protein [Burkholderiales bacterium]
MAIYHLSVKTIGRSAGRSATAAAAYRAACKIHDERTGEIFDYTKKGGVLDSEIVLPRNSPAWANDRNQLWNAAERAETRKNSTVAREFECALPSELSADERKKLAMDFAREIVDRHGCVADVSVHEPNKKGDERNYHAHILCSTRRLSENGFTEKTRELDDKKTKEVDHWRERFSDLQNTRFKELGLDARVDHRSFEVRGIDKEPSKHLGVKTTNFERRTRQESDRRNDWREQEKAQQRVKTAAQQRGDNDEISERLTKARDEGIERRIESIDKTILDLSMELEKAKRERDSQAKLAQEQQREPNQRERFAQTQEQKPVPRELSQRERFEQAKRMQEEKEKPKEMERSQDNKKASLQQTEQQSQRERFEQVKREREEQQKIIVIDRDR